MIIKANIEYIKIKTYFYLLKLNDKLYIAYR